MGTQAPDHTWQKKKKVWVTNVSDEAAWLLVLQELADTRPGFALQVSEVGGSVLVHTVHMSLLQFHSFRIHPGESRANTRRAGKRRKQTQLEGVHRCDALYMLSPGTGTIRRRGRKTLVLDAWKSIFW
jgi:hypothetical protein